MNDRAGVRRGARRAVGVPAPLQSACDRLPVGFALFDASLRLAASNARFAALRGYPRKLVKVGTPLESLVRFDAERGEYGAGAPEAMVRDQLGTLKRRRRAEREQAMPDGRTVRIVAERVPEGGLLVTCADVTEAHRAAARLREGDERHDFAMRAINEGTYDWDVEKGVVYYSERVYQVLGLSPTDFHTGQGWIERIHPDDQPRFLAATRAHFKGETERFECDYRYRARDGSWRWARQHGLAVRDAAGRALRLIGSTGDITELKERERELAEHVAEQVAVRGLLEAISRSAFDLDAVLRTLIETASGLCHADKGFIFRREGDAYRLAVDFGGVTPEFREFIAQHPIRAGRDTLVGRTALTKSIVHIEDVLADPEYRWPQSQRMGGQRTMLGVPIVRDDAVIGVIALWKERVEPFTLAQVQLVATFSSQAAVAIENARLFQELQAKNDALTAALEQQTATAEILRVISSSPTDLAPVFEAILESALRLCEGNVAALWQFDGAHLHFAKGKGGSTEGVAYLQQHPLPLGNYNPTPQAGLERRPVHVLDVFADARYRPLIAPDTFGTVPNSGTVLAVPLLRGAELLGVITIWRHRKRLFSDRQVAMVTTFADQAVIAIENVRLFNELQLRNRELTESLEQQTATAEILKVISSSPTDVQPVFDAIVKSGVHLFKGVAVSLRLVKGDRIERGAFATGPGCDVSDDMTKPPFPLDDRNFSGRAILRRAVVHVPDVFAEDWVGEEVRKVAARMGWRAIAAAPMLRENKALGAMNVVRARAAPFTEKEIALLRTFADQAVIAIENVRLFKETKDALERQTATAEILKVISSSPTDIQPVLDAVAERAGKLCDAPYANVMLVEGDQLRVMSVYSTEAGPAPDQRNFVPIRRSYVNARAVLEREVVHVPDIIPLMDSEFPDVRRNQQKFGFRAMLVVPLMREGRAVGTIFLWRREPGPFSSDQVALLKTFADQAVIAIENVRLFNETKEALDYQRASAEVLQVISSSVADTQPVFEKVLDSCERLFAGRNVGVNVVGEDGLIRVAAYRGPHREVLLRHFPLPLTEESGSGAAILQRRVVHYSDVEADGVPDHARRGSQLVGNRSVIFAPMLWDGRGIGAIFVGRPTVGEFSEKEITLLKTFADQAVIAIQNARLFNETKEALEKQTAISEILRVISASPTDVQPVFDAIVRSAVTLCGSKDGAVFRYDGERLHYAAGFDQTPEWVDAVRSHYPMRPEASTIAGRAILGLSVVQIDDVLADPAYDHERAVKGGWRRMLAVPMLREGVPLGVIVVSWPQPGPTPKSQEDLLKTFADQAVIAIENVRLFNETKEALDHQKASAEVLQVISSSVSDTEPVFGKILESCERLFASSRVGVNLIGPDGLVHAGAYGNSPGAEKLRNENYPHPVAGSATGAAIIAGRVVHYPDVFGDPDVPPYARRGAEKAGFRSFIMAPLLSEGRGLGAIFVGRETVGPFSEKEIALLKTFADQAVIAIENVRLFNETKEALDQQKASAEVLQVISSSVADAQPVFDKILESCERLFEGRNVGITLVGDDGAVHLGPYRGPDRQELERMYPLPLSTASGSGSAILARRVMHYPDAEGGADVPEPVRRGSRVIGSKSIIFSPMLWEGRGIGAIFVARQAVGEFSEKEIALLKTFADQAVIAIQNAKLFREIQEKSHQLEIADQHKSAFLANMSHELRTPLNAVIGFSEMLAARYFGALTDKQAEYVNDIHGSGKHLLSLINDILDLSKIEAGRMELETAEFDLRTALDNALTLVRERAQRGGVALRLETDPALRTVDGDERKLKQVVLNLLSNAVKFTPRGGTVSVAAKRVDGVAEIAVSDTGVGIAPADQEAIFEAFRQVGTDATRKREGTGLGLALARRFVELHGGTIRVESAPGQGSTFTVTLPLRHGE